MTAQLFQPDIERTARFSRCGLYRYTLGRRWEDSGDLCGWIMLNPSTADAIEDDPTIRRCMNFSRGWGYHGCEIRNIFALRSTDPRILYKHDDPVGIENDQAIAELVKTCHKIICAWGNHGVIRLRQWDVIEDLNGHHAQPMCLSMTKAGCPQHPLYIKGDKEPYRFKLIPRPMPRKGTI